MEDDDLRELEDEKPYFRSLLLESMMCKQGWCPRDAERLRLDLDVSSLLFTAHCGVPPCRKAHDKCNRMICNARQILDTEEYCPNLQPAHPVTASTSLSTLTFVREPSRRNYSGDHFSFPIYPTRTGDTQV